MRSRFVALIVMTVFSLAGCQPQGLPFGSTVETSAPVDGRDARGLLDGSFASGEAATKPDDTRREQETQLAAAAAAERRLNVLLPVLYWGIGLALIGMLALGIILAKRRARGPVHRFASVTTAACCFFVAGVAGWLALPGRSYPDAMGSAGLVDFALLVVAALAGFGGVMALIGALRRPR